VEFWSVRQLSIVAVMSDMLSKAATKVPDSLAEAYLRAKEQYSLGLKTHGDGVVYFDEQTKCFRHVNAVTGDTTTYAGLERSLREYFWPDKPPPTVRSSKYRGAKKSGMSKFLGACASFSASSAVGYPVPLIKGKQLGELVHNQIDAMFKTHGAVNKKFVIKEHSTLTSAIIDVLEKEALIVIDTEVICWDPDTGLATRADILCKKEKEPGRLYIVEVKTGGKKNFYLYNTDVVVDSGNGNSVKTNDSSYNRARTQVSATSLQFSYTYDIPIDKCTPIVLHAPFPTKVKPLYVPRDFVLGTALWIYLETAEARKRGLVK
jgi:hypothetical protein